MTNPALQLAEEVRLLAQLKDDSKTSAREWKDRVERQEEKVRNMAADIREGQGRLDFGGDRVTASIEVATPEPTEGGTDGPRGRKAGKAH